MIKQNSIQLAIDVAPFHHRFLVLFGCLCLVLLERGFAQWGLFFDSAPLLSFLIVGYLGLYFPALLPLGAVFILGLFGDIIGLAPLGFRSFVLPIFYMLIKWRSDSLRDEDFLAIWAQISLFLMAMSVIKLCLYIGLYFSLPDLLSLGYQTGMTILIFPIFFVIGSAITSIMQRQFGS